jgi:hypothetical protein
MIPDAPIFHPEAVDELLWGLLSVSGVAFMWRFHVVFIVTERREIRPVSTFVVYRIQVGRARRSVGGTNSLHHKREE